MCSAPNRPADKLGLPLTTLSGVGPALSTKLEKLGLRIVEDLLFLLPLRFEDRTRLTPIGSLRLGQRALVSGEILLSEVSFRGRRALLIRIGDGTGQLTVRLFHFSRSQQLRLARGARISCYGEVRAGPGGVEMVHPQYQHLGEDQDPIVEETLTPVYPMTEGVAQGRLRRLVGLALEYLSDEAPDELVPREILEPLNLPGLTEAILFLHRPPVGTDMDMLRGGFHPSLKRLALEELLAHHLSLCRRRDQSRQYLAPQLMSGAELVDQFLKSLPYTLTGAQARVLEEIRLDMGEPSPMLRLVQGDVGSGKTVVAAAATVQAVASNRQVALMAPTMLLAEQHRRNFVDWLEPLGINVVLLRGSLKAAERREAESAITDGSAAVVIGTHALFQKSVSFNRLGLVIIDEQHRFGVDQRLSLTERGSAAGERPHQLVMTATPIPRTLAMTAYADLDASIIDELPPGRTPVQTVVMPETRRDQVIERVRDACLDDCQAYWVCPLVEESDVLDYQAAEASFERLRTELPNIRVGLVHGRMAPKIKEPVMRSFKAGEIDLLVATTVIEVGVDVPKASLMIIENAERLGLAQLHQLRGRVGRGRAESTAVLLYRPPLSDVARERLAVMRETNDGFVVAEKDLQLRGPGEVLGTRQTGAMHFRIADLTRDADLLQTMQRAATIMRRGDSARVDAIIERWLGTASRYGSV